MIDEMHPFLQLKFLNLRRFFSSQAGHVLHRIPSIRNSVQLAFPI